MTAPTLTVLARLERCCHSVFAIEEGGRYRLTVEGGMFDGAWIQCSSEASLLGLFDRTRDAFMAGVSPWWLGP